MMAHSFDAAYMDDGNPLSQVEEFAVSKGWRFVRHDEDFLAVFIKGPKGEYEISLEWQDEFSALLLGCPLKIRLSEAQYEMGAKAVEQINQNIWLGHFDLSSHDDIHVPTFRYTLLCRMFQTGGAVEIVADLIDLTVSECNRFFTVFELLAAGDVRLEDNLHAVTYETIGRA